MTSTLTLLAGVEGDGAAPFPGGDFFGASFFAGAFSFSTPGDAPDLPPLPPPNRNMPPKDDEPLLATAFWGSGAPFAVAAGFAEGPETTLETAFDVILAAAVFEGAFGAGFGAAFDADFGAALDEGLGGDVGGALGSGFAGSAGAFAEDCSDLGAVFGELRVAGVARRGALEAGSFATVALRLGFGLRLIASGVIESTNLRTASGAGRPTKSGRGMPNPARTPKMFPSPSVSPVEGSIGQPLYITQDEEKQRTMQKTGSVGY